jgi:hypothetical protein
MFSIAIVRSFELYFVQGESEWPHRYSAPVPLFTVKNCASFKSWRDIGDITVAILTCWALICLSSGVHARNYFTPDGQFTICKFRQLQDCATLSPDIVASAQFTESERDTLRKLQKLPGLNRLEVADLTAAFGKPNAVLQPPGYPGNPDDGLIYEWLTDAKEVCALCGVRIAFFGGKLFSIDFDVNNKFMIVWHRRVPDAAVPQDPPRR